MAWSSIGSNLLLGTLKEEVNPFFMGKIVIRISRLSHINSFGRFWTNRIEMQHKIEIFLSENLSHADTYRMIPK